LHKKAFVFPGQGSQSIGMLSDLHNKHSVVREVFAESTLALGYDLWSLIQEGPKDKLDQTEYTQPALLASGVACWRLWEYLEKPRPCVLAGHSLGEYTALVCAGALSLADAILLVAARGRFMQQTIAKGDGAMAAILGLDQEQITMICQASAQGGIVQPANINAPGQIVISGEHLAVERAVVLAKQQGAKRVILLPVSVPSHCDLMQPAAKLLEEKLARINWREPNLPVIHNVDVKSHKTANDICSALMCQLYSPVRWIETIQTVVSMGVNKIIECGPGKVLTGLNKRIAPDITVAAIGESF
jgi:[acyl-carrier-protein] S-malonyltransferase